METKCVLIDNAKAASKEVAFFLWGYGEGGMEGEYGEYGKRYKAR